MARKPARRPASARGRKVSKQGRKTKQARGARRQVARGAGRRGARKAGGRKTSKPVGRKTTPTKSAKAPTKPMPAKRSTGTPAGPATPKRAEAGAGSTRRVPALDRARRQLREIEEGIPTPPSSLDLDRTPSAARSGRAEMREARRDHTETSPVLTGGDVDASWEDAYAVGDEAPGGDNPTPDQDRVDDIGKALGVEYQDNEELRPTDKIADRDKKRWELDPASAEDYRERD